VQAGNFGAIRVLAEYGTEDQKKRYLQRLLSGEGVICVGMTEPEAGSAVTRVPAGPVENRPRTRSWNSPAQEYRDEDVS
jgi:alkylation response protein AidB-like acyl-CoA dehydrogenase